MPRARSELVCVDTTPYYHVISRCVRRAFLCGKDEVSGKDYNHRREWIEQRLRLLSSLFAIDVCAYAVMSNHYHLVVRINTDEVNSWSDQEVVSRWLNLFKGESLSHRYINDEPMDEREYRELCLLIARYRERLGSLSWFMKCMNEPIARQANKEDDCTGCFWESRFRSQALKDEKALLACMAYVDLNPVRAGMAKTPEESEFTSIRERIQESFDLERAVNQQTCIGMPFQFDQRLKPLLSFSSKQQSKTNLDSLPFSQEDYYQLVDWTGRQVREKKRGSISSTLPPILARLGYRSNSWLDRATGFEQWHRHRSWSKQEAMV